MDIAHSPPKINSFCLNTVLVPYKMMIAVVLSFRLNRTVKKLPEPNTLSYQTLGQLLQGRLIPFDQTLHCVQCTEVGTLQDDDGCGEMPTLSKQQD